MSGAQQISFMNQRSFGPPPPPPPPEIGDAYGGGFFAGQIGVDGVATHNLVVGPLSTAQFTGSWKTSAALTAGTTSNIDGPANTAAMIAAGAAAHPCANFCNNLTLGGYTDWYMPAINELEVLYFNLKFSTTINNTSSGINPNAVPARASNYTAGNPAQTSATAFQWQEGVETLSVPGNDSYWSSTPSSSSPTSFALRIAMNTGYKAVAYKANNFAPVRAVRRVPV